MKTKIAILVAISVGLAFVSAQDNTERSIKVDQVSVSAQAVYDNTVNQNILAAIKNDKSLAAVSNDISVCTFQSEVTLSGFVYTQQEKKTIEDIVSKIGGLKTVNLICIYSSGGSDAQ